MDIIMESCAAQRFKLDKNGFVELTTINAELAQNEVNNLAKDLDNKKSLKMPKTSANKKYEKTRKTLSAILEDNLEKKIYYTYS